MNKIVFISDFFEEQVSGGAEICDNVLIQELSKTYKICKFNSSEFTVNHFNLYKSCGFSFLISNFVALSEDVKNIISLDGEYCIIEHDHKYLRNRNPSVFANFKAPEQMLINVDFYRSAKKVFCQSAKHYKKCY
jgi:AAA+ ATPase superfamily predicted ATPase